MSAQDPESQHRLKIAFILSGLHSVNRGAEVAFEAVASRLSRSEAFDVTLFGMGHPKPDDPYRFVHVSGVRRNWFRRIPSLPVMRDETSWEELIFSAALFAKYRPNDFDAVISCSYPFINWLISARAAGDRSPRHLFVTQNGDWPVRSNQREFKYFHCDGIICTNPDYYECHRERWKSVLIPNGVEPDRFRPGPGERSRFGIPPGAPIVLMVSAFIPSKRLVEGIRVVAQLDDAHLIVAGAGPLRSQIMAAGRQLLQDRFHLLELPREEMPALYQTADVLLHMSIDEPSANAYIEAMATGLPVVTHDRPVTRWTFQDVAYLVDTTNSEQVTAALRQAIGENEPKLVNERRQRAVDVFAWDSIALKYADFIRDTV